MYAPIPTFFLQGAEFEGPKIRNLAPSIENLNSSISFYQKIHFLNIWHFKTRNFKPFKGKTRLKISKFGKTDCI